MDEQQPEKPFPYWLISTILLLIVIAGMGIGWWRTLQRAKRAEQRAQRAEIRAESFKRQIDPFELSDPYDNAEVFSRSIPFDASMFEPLEVAPVEAPPVQD